MRVPSHHMPCWQLVTLVGVVSSACSAKPNMDTSLPSPSQSTPTKQFTTITFAHPSGVALSLDLFKPNGKRNLHRGILLIHGGGWVGGIRGEMTDIGTLLAQKGFTCASVDYRFAPKWPWPAQLEDVQQAVRFMRAHATEWGIDPNHIGASGISAGGHLSAFLATTYPPGASTQVQAAGCISSIDDLNLPLTPEGETYHIVQKLLGETSVPDRERRTKASPITFFDRRTSPILFIQGKQDPLVPSEQTAVAVAKLKSLKVATDAIYVDGMQHGINASEPRQAKALEAMADWMTKHLAVR
ncbi:MAG: alpha/beta hydrolase [Fimbriimonas sp.]|nr:alpha/beta hydrolase [Fimbriimonas sp.]